MVGASFSRTAALLLLAFATGLVAGCGGGGGGGDIPVSGIVYQGRLAGTRVANATVSAYVWSDLSTPVASTTTKSDGHYSLRLPSTAANKDVVLIAATPTPATSTNLRASLLVAAMPVSGRTNADIDIATTLAAEVAAKQGKDTNVAHFSDSSVQTIASEFRNWEGTANLQPVANGTELPAQFGAGLKPGSASSTYAATNPVIGNALQHLEETASADTLAAKRMVRWLRDTAHYLFNDGQSERNALRDALDEQRQVLHDEVQVSSAVGQRLGTVIKALFNGQEVWDGSSMVTMPPLRGQAPGNYTWQQNANGDKYLTYTGPAADGKSWIVTSTVPDATLNDRITITPANKLDTFQFTPVAGSYSIRAINTTESDSNRTLDWSITITFSGPATAPTSFAVTMSMKDPGLTGLVKLQGTVSGVVVAPASGSNGAPTYSQLSLTGSINAPFFIASLGSLTVKWYESTAKASNLQSVTLSNVLFTDNLSKPIKGSLSSASITFDRIASATQKPQFALPNDMKVSGSQISFSDHTLKLNSAEAKFQNTVHADGSVDTNVKELDGDIAFQSSALSLSGTMNSTWSSLLANKLGDSSPMPVSQYPVGTVSIKGQVQPTGGLAGVLDTTLAFASTSTAATATFTINQLSYENEALTGTIVVSTPVVGGYLQGPSTVTANLTETPRNLKLHIESTSGGVSGWVSTSSTGTPKLADIGKAGDLGLSQLGSNVLVIKYSDNTFETAASILPD